MAKLSVNKKEVLKILKKEKEKNRTRNVTLKLEVSLLESLKNDCDKEGLSMSEVIKILIKKYLGKES